MLMFRVLVHVVRGDSVDPVGDYVAILQELELYNPRLLNKTQVIVVNKIDIPEVRERLDELLVDLRRVAGHTRVLGISAATGENVKPAMLRIMKLVNSLPKQTAFELFFEESDDSIQFVDLNDDGQDSEFEILTDDRYPGNFRIVGKKIEKVFYPVLSYLILITPI
jgi:GTPase